MRLSSLLVHCILTQKKTGFKETDDADLPCEGTEDDLPFEDSTGLATGVRSQAKCPNEVFQL